MSLIGTAQSFRGTAYLLGGGESKPISLLAKLPFCLFLLSRMAISGPLSGAGTYDPSLSKAGSWPWRPRRDERQGVLRETLQSEAPLSSPAQPITTSMTQALVSPFVN